MASPTSLVQRSHTMSVAAMGCYPLMILHDDRSMAKRRTGAAALFSLHFPIAGRERPAGFGSTMVVPIVMVPVASIVIPMIPVSPIAIIDRDDASGGGEQGEDSQ